MISEKRGRFIDLNTILIVFNLIILILSTYAYFFSSENEYVNQQTFFLGIVVCMQTHFALFLERRSRDPFVIILTYIIIFYYSMRILTLTLYPFSVTFLRFPSSITPQSLNYTVLFIIIANFFLYAGFSAKKFKANKVIDVGNWKASSTNRVIFILTLVIFISYSKATLFSSGILSRPFLVLSIFISQSIIIMMVIVYIYIYKQSLSQRSYIILVGLVMAEMMLHMMIGSRGAILGLIQSIIIVNLIIYGCMKFRTWQVGFGLAVLPFILALMSLLFLMSTYIRSQQDKDHQGINISRAIQLSADAISSINYSFNGMLLLAPLFDRLGYLDYNVDIITNQKTYSSVVNLPAYGKSLIDNIFTPGFDVFDQPRISFTLQFLYNPYFSDTGVPLKSRVMENYQSDQLGLYSELYVLFGGYFSLPLFFIVA
ncbi:MAG: hypothetical protein IPJ69_04470 [Deltaproteobacteria bacterium]|nr:MAG: hypothetical protein IPJ69_04470 [Deltaproteobacteria bacterium]